MRFRRRKSVNMVKAILVNEHDNVAMVTSAVEEGQGILVAGSGQSLAAKEPIGPGHKVALVRMEAGESVIKFGIPIGRLNSAVDAGGLVSVHNLDDVTEELLGAYCKEFREGAKKVKEYPAEDGAREIRKIKAYPRQNGTFGIRNYIMVISTSPGTNAAAEAISGRTGCAWFVCDRTRLDGGKITEYTEKAMIYTGRNPNIYAALVLGDDSGASDSEGIYRGIAETGKPVRYMPLGKNTEQEAVSDGCAIINEYQRDAAGLKRELVSMEGFGLAVHCSASDWTTAINGNSSLGAAADILVKNKGRVFMTEWMEWSGSQHVLAEKCASYELALELLDTLDGVRATVLRETGRPVEYMNPVPEQKLHGLTTLVEKSTGTIRKIGSSRIEGLLDFCEQPAGPGVWLPKHDSVWPPTTAIYGALSGAHMAVHVSGIGYIYYEIPHMICIRATGNPVTFGNEDFKFDFNAGTAFDGVPIPEIGEALFEYIVRVAEGGEDPNTEPDKVKAFNMYYYNENEFGEKADRSKMLYCKVDDYHEKYDKYTDRVK